MNICRNIYYDGKYRGLFELRNVEGKFMWCPAHTSKYPVSYPYPKVLYKNHLDHPYCDYSCQNFTFDAGDLDLPEEENENNCSDYTS